MEPHFPGPSGSSHPPKLALSGFRKTAGISLDEIAERTKISVRFLRAIESEEFDQLPGGIFTTSYLRQYAAAIGYDEDALVAFYLNQVNPQTATPKGAQRESGSRRLLYRWLRTPAQAQQ
ncbi:MAG TPA: helix-turn-helix transcriptional regulator [Bryobacteraceae bacterium]|nr:helix-turn-helix transcriptional regulator [Bryobacteraceae bacterium]